MKISARNTLKGTIETVNKGAVNGIVKLNLGCRTITSDITNEAIEDLALAPGKEAYAVIKASNVMFAAGSEPVAGLSCRNQLPGTVTTVTKGAVNGHVTLELPCGAHIKGSITNEAIDELGLAQGTPAVALIKSSDVMIAVD
jgi:molybdate transport system regulatory protein